MKYIFTNIIGSFVFDEKLNIIDKIIFNPEDYNNKESFAEKLTKKHSPKPLPQEKLFEILVLFKDKNYFSTFYQNNLTLTKQDLRNSVQEDILIIQAIANINELDKAINLLTKRLREWYGLYFPELEQNVSHQEKIVELILSKDKTELSKEFNIKDTMGADLKPLHLQEIKLLAKNISQLMILRKEHEEYLEKVMREYCPNLLELAGTTIAARLIELGKSLKHLAMLPASTIQLFGAEKALFRHIKTGSRPPKYGVIINHPIIQKAKREDKGKASRTLADKLSLCARLDFFKGEFKAKEYLKQLEEKFIK